jgi:hypothetical protein
MSAQILTTEDLMEFKLDLLEEIKKLMHQSGVQPVKKWLKSPEVRKLLDVSPNTLQNMRINGSLPFTKIGGAYYYDYEDLLKMLASRKMNRR